MAVADHAPTEDFEAAFKQRFGEGLAPWPGFLYGLGQFTRELAGRKLAVRQVFIPQQIGGYKGFKDFIKTAGEPFKTGFIDGQTGRHGMPAKGQDQVRVAARGFFQ